MFRLQNKYEISETYDRGLSGFAGDYEYWGYTKTNGGWIIQRHQISTGEYRYVAGATGLTAAWAAKVGLTYVTYDRIFA